MNVALYIARRYFVARKSHNIINIISWISVAGIATGAFAMVVVLSVFNGFEGLVRSLYNVFDPDLLVVPVEGKTFSPDADKLSRIKQLNGVWFVTSVVEETALLRYGSRQDVVVLKGVDNQYQFLSPVNSMVIDGRLLLEDTTRDFLVAGAGVAYKLGLSLHDEINPVMVYLPRRGTSSMVSASGAFASEPVFASGVFSVQQDFDTKYVLTSLRLMHRLLDYSNQVTSIEIRLHPEAVDKAKTKDEIAAILGSGFAIKDRYQQQEMLYKIMKSEKWAVFLILSFIILVSAFNVVGSLIMLIIDKRKDMAIMEAMGARRSLVQRIFFFEGLIISVGGATVGLVLGFLACLLQQEFGILKLGNEGSTFVVSSYPVEMQAGDFLFTFVVVLTIGLVSSILPSHQLKKKYEKVVRFKE
jgi:lipoprotein-releasing system permease protein